MAKTDCTERWRQVTIPEYADDYEVSNMGRIRRRRDSRPSGNGAISWRAGRLITPNVNTAGYNQINLRKKGAPHKVPLVHHLVMLAFVGAIPAGQQVNHKNGIKTDNRLANLEYVTASENVQHGYDTGLHIANRGEQLTWAKLKEADIRPIRRLYKFGVSAEELAARYGVSSYAIKAVVYRRNWKHVTD